MKSLEITADMLRCNITLGNHFSAPGFPASLSTFTHLSKTGISTRLRDLNSLGLFSQLYG